MVLSIDLSTRIVNKHKLKSFLKHFKRLQLMFKTTLADTQ